MSELPPLPQLELGTYRHNKTGHLYEVIGVGLQTETSEPLVVYKPLWDSDYPLYVRPYAMFVEEVEQNGVVAPRFEKVQS